MVVFGIPGVIVASRSALRTSSDRALAIVALVIGSLQALAMLLFLTMPFVFGV